MLLEALQVTTVPVHEAALLRIVPTPAIGSCVYSCVALALASDDAVYEWNCALRGANGVASEPEREAKEKEMAAEVAGRYDSSVDPEHTPDPSEYEPIAKASSVTLRIHMLSGGELIRFDVNPGASAVAKLFLAGSGGSGLRDCKGHFDFIHETSPELAQIPGQSGHGGFGN